MPGFVLDTSALLKRYHLEDGSPAVRALFTPDARVAISSITPLEFASALTRLERSGLIRAEARVSAVELLHVELRAGLLWLGAPPSSENLSLANALLLRHGALHGLRTLDALQLALAARLRDETACDTLVTADRVMCRVAALEDWTVLNPLTP